MPLTYLRNLGCLSGTRLSLYDDHLVLVNRLFQSVEKLVNRKLLPLLQNAVISLGKGNASQRIAIGFENEIRCLRVATAYHSGYTDEMEEWLFVSFHCVRVLRVRPSSTMNAHLDSRHSWKCTGMRNRCDERMDVKINNTDRMSSNSLPLTDSVPTSTSHNSQDYAKSAPFTRNLLHLRKRIDPDTQIRKGGVHLGGGQDWRSVVRIV